MVSFQACSKRPCYGGWWALAVGGLIVGLGWWWLGRWARSEEVSIKAAIAGANAPVEGARHGRGRSSASSGAGLAAVYDVPISGVLFTREVLLASFALRDLVPAVATSVIATVITWPVLSTSPTYDVGAESFEASVLVWALALGNGRGPTQVAFAGG